MKYSKYIKLIFGKILNINKIVKSCFNHYEFFIKKNCTFVALFQVCLDLSSIMERREH